MIAAYYAQTRSPYRVLKRATLAEAIASGLALRVPFDVSVESGAIVWVWEQREDLS